MKILFNFDDKIQICENKREQHTFLARKICMKKAERETSFTHVLALDKYMIFLLCNHSLRGVTLIFCTNNCMSEICKFLIGFIWAS